MTQLLLVRHGQSEWNALGRWQGRADPPLTELGRQQAFHAATRIGSVDLICASPLDRALHTARIISEQLGVGPVVVVPDLAERDAGEWQGLTRAEIEQQWPGYLATGRRPPGYEDQDELVARAHGALDLIAAEYDGAEVLVLTHGGVINAVEQAAGLPWERMPNLGGRRVTHHGDRLAVGDRLVLVDDDELTVPSQI
jgi:broad specificity phosphatase PhoE